jgi:UDP-N-acetyl-2-amino-2-deoxyglucuronate dehydrogenase
MRLSASRPVRMAVIGCGNIGSRHLHFMSENPDAEISAVCDTDPVACEKYATRYGVPGFVEYEQLLKNVETDVISICTPHALHTRQTIQAIDAGKHVLVEKPMALTVGDALRMKQAAAAKGLHLMVVWQNRHNVPIRLTYDALRAGKLGRIFMVHCSVFWNRPQSYYDLSDWRGGRRLEGGALFTQCSHFLDLLIHFFGEIETANSIGDTKNHDIEIEDCGSAILQFQSGVLGSLTYTTCVHNRNYEGSITIVGEHGTIKIGGQYLNTIDFWDVKDYPLPADVQFNDKPNQYSAYAGSASNHDKVIADVITTVRAGQHPDATVPRVPGWTDGHRVVRAIQMIYQSQAKAGSQVTLQQFETEEEAFSVSLGIR